MNLLLIFFFNIQTIWMAEYLNTPVTLFDGITTTPNKPGIIVLPNNNFIFWYYNSHYNQLMVKSMDSTLNKITVFRGDESSYPAMNNYSYAFYRPLYDDVVFIYQSAIDVIITVKDIYGNNTVRTGPFIICPHFNRPMRAVIDSESFVIIAAISEHNQITVTKMGDLLQFNHFDIHADYSIVDLWLEVTSVNSFLIAYNDGTDLKYFLYNSDFTPVDFEGSIYNGQKIWFIDEPSSTNIYIFWYKDEYLKLDILSYSGELIPDGPRILFDNAINPNDLNILQVHSTSYFIITEILGNVVRFGYYNFFADITIVGDFSTTLPDSYEFTSIATDSQSVIVLHRLKSSPNPQRLLLSDMTVYPVDAMEPRDLGIDFSAKWCTVKALSNKNFVFASFTDDFEELYAYVVQDYPYEYTICAADIDCQDPVRPFCSHGQCASVKFPSNYIYNYTNQIFSFQVARYESLFGNWTLTWTINNTNNTNGTFKASLLNYLNGQDETSFLIPPSLVQTDQVYYFLLVGNFTSVFNRNYQLRLYLEFPCKCYTDNECSYGYSCNFEVGCKANTSRTIQNELINNALELLQNLTLIGGNLQSKVDLIKSFEDAMNFIYQNKCPSCTGNGYCDGNSICICEPSRAGLDCSLKSTDYESYLKQKENILSSLSLTLMNSSSYMNALKVLSDTNFNNNITMSIIQDKFDDFMNQYNNSIIPELYLNASITILDSLLAWISENDCGKSLNLTVKFENEVQYYFAKVSESTLQYLTGIGNTTIYSEDTFDMYLKKISICTAYNLINFTESSFAINITSKTVSFINCDDFINIEYLAIDSDLFNCSLSSAERTKGVKELYSINITSSKGEDLMKNYAIELIAPNICPNKCETLANKNCYCDDLSIFDIKNQIYALFANSGLSKLGDFSSLSNWVFYKDFSFFIITGVFSGVIAAAVITYLRFQDTCITSPKKLRNLGTCKKFLIALMVNNTLLNAMYVKIDHSPKGLRIYLFFVKMMILILFTAVFNFPDSIDIEINLSLSLLFSISPYTFSLPYVTIIPFFNFLAYLMKLPAKRTIFVNIKIFMGFLLSLSAIIFCCLGSFIISSSRTSNQRLAWAVCMIFAFTQDLFFNPLSYTCLQTLLIKIKPKKNSACFSRFCNWIITDEMLRIFRVKKKKMRIERMEMLRSSTDDATRNNKQVQRKVTNDTSSEDLSPTKKKSDSKIKLKKDDEYEYPNQKQSPKRKAKSIKSRAEFIKSRNT